MFAKHILMKNTSNHSADQMFLVPMVTARVVLSSFLSFARFTKGFKLKSCAKSFQVSFKMNIP